MYRFFFPKWGISSLSINRCIQRFIKLIIGSILLQFKDQRGWIYTWISHLKIHHDKSRWNVNMSIFCQTATRIGYIYPEQPLSKGCTQYPCTALLRRLEKRPHMDPVGSQRDNLQKWWEIWFVKDKIILNMPYAPYDCTNSHSYVNFCSLDNAIKPITKKMWNAGRRSIVQIILAKGYSMNRCCTFSLWSQKQQV
jgi:hypothetical protein